MAEWRGGQGLGILGVGVELVKLITGYERSHLF